MLPLTHLALPAGASIGVDAGPFCISSSFNYLIRSKSIESVLLDCKPASLPPFQVLPLVTAYLSYPLLVLDEPESFRPEPGTVLSVAWRPTKLIHCMFTSRIFRR